jgi:LDH2 family malate/lactate/ureidoglycolate dehydrogenase
MPPHGIHQSPGKDGYNEMAETDERSISITETDLNRFCSEIFKRLDLPAADADTVADCLVEGDLRGVHSHGVIRLPVYVRRLQAGAYNARPDIRVDRETRTTAVLDGDNGMGQLVSRRAMALAIEKAKAGDCVWVSVYNSNHNGTEAYFAQMALEHDMIGFCFTVGGINHVAPWGGAEAMLGNNPFGIAIPAGEQFPVVLDMACSVAARGKVNVAAARGEPIPEGWCTDAQGRPTTDPHEALKGFVLPMAGAKGYALTTVIGMLSTMLSGGAFGTDVTHLYDDFDRPQNIGHLLGVLPVESFVDVAEFKKRMDKSIRDIKNVKKSPGVDEIFLPGEREYRTLIKHRRSGIPLAIGTVRELKELGSEFNVPLCPTD